jgi:hypothetical protein
MEDDPKILKVEYISNHLLDHTQTLNLSVDNKTMLQILKIKTTKMEDNLQNLDNLDNKPYFTNP